MNILSSEQLASIENILNEQIATVDEIFSIQKEMYENVVARDWLESEKKIRTIDTFSKKFLELDKKNFDIITRLGGESVLQDEEQEEKIDFLMFTHNLDNVSRKRLENLYKILKEKIRSSKIENEVFSCYVNHAQTLVTGIMDIISEERNGKCYTRNGYHVNADITSLVLNQTI